MKNLILILFTAITLSACTKTNQNVMPESYTPPVIIGSATFNALVSGADTLTQEISFIVQQEPERENVTNDYSLCTVTVDTDTISVEFPVYEDVAGSSLSYSMVVTNFDSEGNNIGWRGQRSFTRVNVQDGDVIQQ